MIDTATDISRRTFLKHVGRDELAKKERDLGYELNAKQGLTMANDFHVSYHKSTYQGRPCVYFRWSGIEHIYV